MPNVFSHLKIIHYFKLKDKNSNDTSFRNKFSFKTSIFKQRGHDFFFFFLFWGENIFANKRGVGHCDPGGLRCASLQPLLPGVFTFFMWGGEGEATNVDLFLIIISF